MSPADSHPDEESLALLALGEELPGSERQHLADCPGCRETLAELQEAVRIGRSSLDEERLAEPSPRVWTSIALELGLDSAGGRTEEIAPSVGETALSGTLHAAGDRTPHRAPRRRAGGKGRRWTFVAVAASVVLVAAGVTGIGLALQQRDGAPSTVASATLDAFPDWPGARGEATVEEVDGARDVRVTVDADESSEGYREVWLLTSDASELVSLGVLEGSEGTFTVPDDIDLARYDVVDVSLEPADGDPQHSGNSIVRGTLRS